MLQRRQNVHNNKDNGRSTTSITRADISNGNHTTATRIYRRIVLEAAKAAAATVFIRELLPKKFGISKKPTKLQSLQQFEHG